MNAFVVFVGAVVNAAVIGFFARRLIGVPVGWPRTIVLSMGVYFGIAPMLAWVAEMLHLAPITGHRAAGIPEFFVIGLVILWIVVVEVIVLAILEALLPTGSVLNPVTFARTMPSRWRRARRYSAILAITTKHGLGAYLRPRSKGPDTSDAALARSLREAFTEGGVTFVKLGQMLSTRPDLLPQAYVDELSRLHSNVPPEPWESVRPILEAELGAPVAEVFATIDPTPMAAASVAQIHAARLPDGTPVVVKIQRPKARAQATADLDIVLRLARLLDRHAEWARHLGVVDLAHGFADSLREELDYRVELANMQALAAASPDLRIPTPYPQLSGQRVIVMERMAGRPLSSADDMLNGITASERAAMAERLFGAVLQQILGRGVFHADLHAGNILVDEDGTLGLLDFGAVGRLDQAGRHSLSTLLLAVDRQDGIIATDALIALLGTPPGLDDRRLELQLGQLIVRYGGGVGSGGSAQLFIDLFDIVLQHRLSVPQPVAAAFRAMGALEGSLLILTRDLDIVSVARERGQSLLAEALTPTEVRGTIEAQLATMLPLLQRLPRRVNRLADDLQGGTFTMNIRPLASPSDRSFVTGLVQQLVVAMLAAALTVGGIILAVSDVGPIMTAGLSLFTYLGFVLLLFAFVLGSRALVLVFRQTAGTAPAKE